MSDWVVDDRGGICEQCQNQYQSLSQHWSRSASCQYPSVDDETLEVIKGCLLGDGALDDASDGSPALRISSARQQHAEWLHHQLGWVSRGVSHDSREMYRIRTMSHPVFDRFWSWQGAPPENGWTLTQSIARIWYACDGSIEWIGRDQQPPRAAWTITNDSKRETAARRLSELGYDPNVWDRRIALSPDETERWLAWLGEPTPGSEYKWCTDRDEYEAARGEL